MCTKQLIPGMLVCCWYGSLSQFKGGKLLMKCTYPQQFIYPIMNRIALNNTHVDTLKILFIHEKHV